MKTQTSLIIPDLHLRHAQAEKIIKHVGADEIIFLGDLWDDFDDTPEMIRDTSEWFVWSVNQPNRIHLIGNHCIHYMYAYRTFECSGYAQWKYFLIDDIVSRKEWNKLKFYHFLDDRWLLTHAGLHKLNVPDSILKISKNRPEFIKKISEYLDNEVREGFRLAATNKGSWIFNAGHARGGNQRIGGITWCDFNAEFFPIKGLNQIFGHTPQGFEPKWCLMDKNERGFISPYNMYVPTLEKLDNPDCSTNLCLDVNGNTHYAVWNGEKLTVGNYRDL